MIFKHIVAAGLLCAVAGGASATTVQNGTFDAGSLAGWTITSENGNTRVQDVMSFNTTGAGASNAARFNVGAASFPGVGGINFSQTLFVTTAGLHNFSLDFASSVGADLNDDGGLFELLVGGVLIDSFAVGVIGANTTVRGMLSGSTTLAAGNVDFTIRITRQFINSVRTPFQYIDNVSAVGPAASPIPLPAGLPLLVAGLGGLAIVGRRRRRAA